MKNYLVVWVLSLTGITLSPFTYAEETKKVLIVSAMHSAHAKVNLLNQLSEKKNIHFKHQSARLLGDDKKALFSQYALIIFDSMGARDGKKSFSPFAPIINQTKTRFLAINWLENATLRKMLTMHKQKYYMIITAMVAQLI